MLSRAAERVYWAGRYLERAENSARLVQQYSLLLLDLPDEVGVDWSELVHIVGAASLFDGGDRAPTEQDVTTFLLSDPDMPCSLAFAIRMARENVRNTRDLLPQESWESINELNQYARKYLSRAARSRDRYEILSECIGRCQQIGGLLSGTMSHGSPYDYLVLGQSIERADMTSRIIDVAAAYIQQNEALVKRYGSTLWTHVLKSVSAFQMYRQYRQPQVVGVEVIDYLLRDGDFPRSIAWCLGRAASSAARLPRSARTLAALGTANELVDSDRRDSATAESVSQLMDDVQRRLGDVHAEIAATWFLPGET